jgi:hypothetical protein
VKTQQPSLSSPLLSTPHSPVPEKVLETATTSRDRRAAFRQMHPGVRVPVRWAAR